MPEIDNGTKIQVKFADPLKNITLKKDAKFETTDKKNPADKLQLKFCNQLGKHCW